MSKMNWQNIGIVETYAYIARLLDTSDSAAVVYMNTNIRLLWNHGGYLLLTPDDDTHLSLLSVTESMRLMTSQLNEFYGKERAKDAVKALKAFALR